MYVYMSCIYFNQSLTCKSAHASNQLLNEQPRLGAAEGEILQAEKVILKAIRLLIAEVDTFG